MKKLTIRQKAWINARSRKGIRTLSKRKKEEKRTSPSKANMVKPHGKQTYIVSAPAHLSLIDNCEETLAFFCEVIETLKKCKYGERVFFNLGGVIKISTDSIMYIIALIDNTKRVKTLSIGCLGNIPEDHEACKVIEKSGFYRYVSKTRQSNYNHDYDSKNSVQIRTGKTAKGPLTGEICEFICKNSKRTRIDTKRIYNMILELMTNTNQHAYKDGLNLMCNCWYIYIESTDEHIRFVFLDTGVGIPNTVKRNHIEKIKDKVINSESAYIASALKGEFRSGTGERNRGRGLPEVFEDVKNKEINNLQIISGRGYCLPKADGNIQEIKLNGSLSGTIITWEITK